MPRSAFKLFLACLIIGLFLLCFPKTSWALTTSFRSAQNITTDGSPGYTNLENCSTTDGLTCDRSSNLSFANLYFQNFGDFGIPINANITGVRIRVTGKTDIATYIGVSILGTLPGLPFPANCQDPSDKWTMFSLVSSTIQTYTANSNSSVNFKTCLNASNIKSNNFIFRINRAGPAAWSANIDNLEIAFDYEIAPSPTPSPTSLPSPIPTPPPPFLELPWDYESKGLSFNEAALNINTFFDHEYPLLSTNLLESDQKQNKLTTFLAEFNTDYDYSSHDGYDYGRLAKADYGDPVLAAAAGIATYVNSCGACGNAIHIDHGNGYQTRYYHLQENGLITNIIGRQIHVDAGQEIGKVGATGNVDPPGEAGAHIHFMVIQDKNHDGDFEDNIPDGLVDPFGWQSKLPDPWENYSFFYKGENKTGNKSYYLWNKKIDELKSEFNSNGGVFKNGKTTVTFQPNSTLENVVLYLISTPAKEFADLISVGSGVDISAQNSSGSNITQFNLPFTINIDFSNQDLSRYLVDTLSIYSSSDGIDWVKEPTTVNLDNKNAITQVNHLTHFALMGKRKDSIPAITTASLAGNKGNDNWYRSNLSVSLNAIDKENGLGVDYVLFKKEDKDWEKYEDPILFSSEGNHSLYFYSVDNDENIENPKSITFTIDKTPPEAEIYYPINSKRIEFYGKDGTESAMIAITNSNTNKKIIATDKAGNSLTMIVKILNTNTLSWINILSIQYNNEPSFFPPKNNLAIIPFYNLKTKQLESITQIYSVKDKKLVATVYSLAQNKTKIYTYDKQNKQILKEELPGEHLLKLYTERSTLNYRY